MWFKLVLLGALSIVYCSGTAVQQIPADSVLKALISGTWRTVLEPNITKMSRAELKVLCRSMGLPTEDVSAERHSYYSSTTGEPPVLLNLVCQGNETDIDQCNLSKITETRELGYDSITLSCRAPEYRRGNMLGDIGRLEVKADGEWGAVCSSVTDIAEVACRALNLPSTDARTYTGLYNGGDIISALTNVSCEGHEVTIEDCFLAQFGGTCKNNRYLGLSCETAYDGKVRVDGYMEGEVRVYHNQSWLGVGVSSSSSPQHVASVICRTLNLSTNVVHSRYTKLNRTLWLPNVQCDGTETDLSQCQGTDFSLPWNRTYGIGLIVTCDMGDEDVRLQADGRLEIRHNGLWGTICAKKLVFFQSLRAFMNHEAAATCKYMGKPSTLASVYFPSNSSDYIGPIWLDKFRCHSSNTPWQNCSYGDWGDVDCSHNDDVFIKCEELDESSIKYRLSPEPFPNVGIYEMSLNGEWGTICQHYSIHRNLNPSVLCRSLNMTTEGARMTSLAHDGLFQYKTNKIWLDFVNCTGSETSPLECKHWFLGDNACKRPEGSAGVYCGPPQETPDFSLRLVDGPNNSSGRLEMMMFGEWRTICGRNYTQNAATEACRQLGLETYTVFIGRNEHRPGSSKIWNLAVDCEPLSLQGYKSCSFILISESHCTHSQDVWITCEGHKQAPFSDFSLGDDNVPLIVGCTIGGAAAVFFIALAVFVIVWRKHYRGRSIQPPVYATPAVAYIPAVNSGKVSMEGESFSTSKS